VGRLSCQVKPLSIASYLSKNAQEPKRTPGR
jgi:hypothetical protein